MMRTWKAGISTEQGLALVELIVTLTIVGIVTAAVAPRLLGTDDLKQASRNLSGTIRETYVRAIESRQVQRLCFNVEQDEYWMATACEFVPSTDNGMAPTIRRLAFGVHFLDVDTAGQSVGRERQPAILFYPIGLAQRSVIHLEDRSHRTMSLLIHSLTGLVSTYDGELPANVLAVQSPRDRH
jgi:prepilin-type N-terminal cleavage/methylation domain-containing protein